MYCFDDHTHGETVDILHKLTNKTLTKVYQTIINYKGNVIIAVVPTFTSD